MLTEDYIFMWGPYSSIQKDNFLHSLKSVKSLHCKKKELNEFAFKLSF